MLNLLINSLMKKQLFLVVVAALAMASCSKDESTGINNGNAIDFRAAMQTRASETTTANDNAVVKTIYDPSPVGYHLPSSNAFTGFTYNGSNVSGSSYFGSRFNSPYTSTTDFTDNFGWEFYCNKMTGEGSYDTAGGTIFFPASGYRSSPSGALSSVGSYGYYWSAVPSSTYYGRHLHFYSTYVSPLSNANRSLGFAVRPVQE